MHYNAVRRGTPHWFKCGFDLIHTIMGIGTVYTMVYVHGFVWPCYLWWCHSWPTYDLYLSGFPQWCRGNVPISQIPQFSTQIFHNVPFLLQKCAHMCTFMLQNGALWDMAQLHYGICEIFLSYDWRNASEVAMKDASYKDQEAVSIKICLTSIGDPHVN